MQVAAEARAHLVVPGLFLTGPAVIVCPLTGLVVTVRSLTGLVVIARALIDLVVIVRSLIVRVVIARPLTDPALRVFQQDQQWMRM